MLREDQGFSLALQISVSAQSTRTLVMSPSLSGVWRRLASSARINTQNSVLGQSGRIYLPEKVLFSTNGKPESDILLVRSEGKTFVAKPVGLSQFSHSQVRKAWFRDAKNLRTHIDESQEGHVLIYDYYDADALRFEYLGTGRTEVSVQERKGIFRQVALAVSYMHDKGWIHMDIKPDNVLLDWQWEDNAHDKITIDRVVLADLDISMPPDQAQKLVGHAVGNVMWRSPEGQMKLGLRKSSDVFSLGLLGLYLMTGQVLFNLNFEYMKERGMNPEHTILDSIVRRFGPPPDAVTEYLPVPSAINFMKSAWNSAVQHAALVPHFEDLDEKTYPGLNLELKIFLRRILQIDPANRATIKQVLDDPWWTMEPNTD